MRVEELAERGGLAEVGAGSPRRATEEQADPAPRRSNIGFEAFLIGPLLGFCIWAPIIWAMFFFF